MEGGIVAVAHRDEPLAQARAHRARHGAADRLFVDGLEIDRLVQTCEQAIQFFQVGQLSMRYGDAAAYPGKVRVLAADFGEACTAVNNIAAEILAGASVFPGYSSHRDGAARRPK